MASVSIIIPSYNHALYLQQRLESIAAQTYRDWEAIIIDDKSTDSSVEIITNFIGQNPDFKVKHFIVNENNSGSGYTSWKKGIELAESRYVWIAETDDFCSPYFLHQVMGVFENQPDAALVFTASNYVDENGAYLYDTSNRTKPLNVMRSNMGVFDQKVLTNQMPFHPFITNASAVVFRKPVQEVPESIFSNKQISDLFLWTHLVNGGKFAFLNESLNSFRRHEASTTTLNSSRNLELFYREFVSYINYFNCSKDTIKALIDQYIASFIISKNNSNGLFYLEPLKQIKGVSYLGLRWFYLKSLLTFGLIKLKRRSNA